MITDMWMIWLAVAILLVITYFSRESGSRTGMMDLELFSTWGINDRNNAFVVENVLLFIPYGFVLPWADVRQRHFLINFLTGHRDHAACDGQGILPD